VKLNLRRAREAAQRLLSRLEALDGNAIQILGEGTTTGAADMHRRAAAIFGDLRDAEQRAAQRLPSSRKGIIDYPSREMLVRVVVALWHFCGRDAVNASIDGFLHQITLVLFEALGKPKGDRRVTMRRALEEARERDRDGLLGPATPWVKRNDRPGGVHAREVAKSATTVVLRVPLPRA